MKQYLTPPPSRCYLCSCSPSSCPRPRYSCLVLVIVYQPARQNAVPGIGWAICCQTWSIKVCQVLSVLNCYFDGLPHARTHSPLSSFTSPLLLIVLLTAGLPQPVSSFVQQLYSRGGEGCVADTRRDGFYFAKIVRPFRDWFSFREKCSAQAIREKALFATRKLLRGLEFASERTNVAVISPGAQPERKSEADSRMRN